MLTYLLTYKQNGVDNSKWFATADEIQTFIDTNVLEAVYLAIEVTAFSKITVSFIPQGG